MSPRVQHLHDFIREVRAEHAPDPRLAVFEVEVRTEGEALVLAGATSEPAAAEALHRGIAVLGGWPPVRDEVVRLPEGDSGERVHAVVTAALAPMLAGPAINETQVSQTVLGNHLLVLRRSGRWLQCRAPDGYIGWMHVGYTALVDESDARAWEVGTEGEAWISLGAEVLSDGGEVIARLPWGARVVREADHVVRLPDGRRGRPVGEMVSAAHRPLRFPLRGEALTATSARWLGVPYLWGGVTQAGVDCSGFVQALYRLHGHTLPRDSDQQSRAGEPVEPDETFSNLLPGDLLFFAEEPGRCTHVVMSTGGSRIVHSSLGNGGVARNDLMGRLNYERELRRIFCGARRVIGAGG
ncbi:MAG TPA: C40 family peptidase [Longimicrobiaceae bacterium]|nr:C40 family peptidase [Longimicrobiaceae bacterium]